MTAFDRAWDVVKAPLYDWESYDPRTNTVEWDMPITEEIEQNEFNHLYPDIMRTPLQGSHENANYGGMGETFWVSKDNMARGSAQTNYDTGMIRIHHFEVATPKRGQGNAEKYLREMIEELSNRLEDEGLEPHAHATRAIDDSKEFWNKMVDRGALNSASKRANVRVSPDGEYFKTRIGSDEMKPVWWSE